MNEDTPQKEILSISAILRSELFANLFPDEKKHVLERTGTMTLQKGGVLFSPGQKAGHLYFLVDGVIRVLKQNESGGNDEIARFAPGDIIGDFDFARGGIYDARIEALEDSSLVVFPGLGLTMENFTLETPQIASKILLNATAMVTGRIKGARRLIIENVSWVMELQRQVHEDPGTGLLKQSFINEEINRILEDPMALLMLKPDRFKILVDTLGHDAGDVAMAKIAVILRKITRNLSRGWALRFRSNETGILINKCGAAEAESLAKNLSSSVAALPPVKMRKGESDFNFTGSIAWSVWPKDDKSWDSLFEGTYGLLMDTWKAGGNKIARYRKGNSS